MTRPSNIPSFNMPPIDRGKSIVVGLMVVAGLLSWIFVRQAIAPIDSFFTEYACAQHGNTLLREVTISLIAGSMFLSEVLSASIPRDLR